MTDRERRLIAFALEVLGIMVDAKDWTADTMDDIYHSAMTHGLAASTSDQYGYATLTKDGKALPGELRR